jgi:maleylpyruvate isomerase
MMSWSATASGPLVFEHVFAILTGASKVNDLGRAGVPTNDPHDLTAHRQSVVRQDGPMTDPTPELTVERVTEDLLPEATRRLVRTADGLEDTAYVEPSGLPDWTRAHVLAHLTLNAEGLAGALAGLVEGERVPMYASDDARNGDIDKLAGARPTVIRTRLLGACTEFADALASVPPDEAGTTIDRVPGGRSFTVADVPGMRLREVEIHHADLDAGYGCADWSPEFAAHVLDAMRTRAEAATSFSAHATDLGRRWEYGTGGPTVSGRATDLAWWLTGRGAGAGLTTDDGDLPQIGAW